MKIIRVSYSTIKAQHYTILWMNNSTMYLGFFVQVRTRVLRIIKPLKEKELIHKLTNTIGKLVIIFYP